MIYYKCHKVNFRFGRSYVDSSYWIKKEKAQINWKHTEDKSFQPPITIALNYGEIKWNSEKVSNVKSFTNKYNWSRINYPSKIDDWKVFEKINPIITLNILYIKGKEIVQLNSSCEKSNNTIDGSK